MNQDEGIQMNAKEIREYGVRLTIFENGDVYISTPGDIHILKVKQVYASVDTTIAMTLEEAQKKIDKFYETLRRNIDSLKEPSK